jgi:hypothetical protein
MFKDEADFRKIVGGLRIDTKPNPAHREKLRRQMFHAFAETARQRKAQPTDFQEKKISFMSTPTAKLAAAALIAVAALIGIRQLRSPADEARAALAQAVENTKETPWAHATVKSYCDGQEHVHQQWIYFASNVTFAKYDDGSVWRFDYGKGQEQCLYQPSTNTLEISDLPLGGLYGTDSARNLLDAVLGFWVEHGASVTKHMGKHQGRDVYVYQVQISSPHRATHVDVRDTVKEVVITYFVDHKTNLIVAIRMEHVGDNGTIILRLESEISYPQSGPKDIYDLGVPRTARVIDKTRRPIGTPPYGPTPAPTAPHQGRLELAPINIKLPGPMFVGTRENIRVDHLQPVRTKPRLPFLAPVGTENVALGKPVWASDEEPIIGTVELITDGDKEAADGCYVEFGPFLQHVTIDLQAEHEIYAIVVWHYHRQPRVYFDVVMQIADDPDFVSDVHTVFNNDIDNSAGFGVGTDMHYVETHFGKLIDAKGTQGRYVRLYSNGSTSDDCNHYIEVEVYGKAVE